MTKRVWNSFRNRAVVLALWIDRTLSCRIHTQRRETQLFYEDEKNNIKMINPELNLL